MRQQQDRRIWQLYMMTSRARPHIHTSMKTTKRAHLDIGPIPSPEFQHGAQDLRCPDLSGQNTSILSTGSSRRQRWTALASLLGTCVLKIWRYGTLPQTELGIKRRQVDDSPCDVPHLETGTETKHEHERRHRRRHRRRHIHAHLKHIKTRHDRAL